MSEVKEIPRAKPEAMKRPGPVTEPERRPPTPAPTSTDPLMFMRRFADEMDRMFEDYGLRMPGVFGRGRELLRREAGMIPAEWSPRIDIREREGQLLIRADLPGMKKEEVHVELTEERLTIRGERKQEKQERREGYAYSECSYGRFYRAIPLPEASDPTKAKAVFRNGVLEVAIPVPGRPEGEARKLEIREE